MKTLALVLLIAIQSCSIQSNDIEVEVINDVFLELVGTDYYWKPIPIPPYRPIHPDSLETELKYDEPLNIEIEGITDTFDIDTKELRQKWIEEYEKFDWVNYFKEVEEFEYKLNNRKLDSSRLVIVVSDSLITINRNSLLNSILTEKGFNENFEVDPTWRSLAIKLVDSTSHSRKFDLSKITEAGRYNIENDEDYEKKEIERVIGAVRFSRVAFDDEFNRGCFYYSFVCGGECGEGVIVFIRKVKGKWIIEGIRQLWIS
ncbi:hypothetical protein ACFCT7_00210 [Fulvivirgaceae bacterium LMO-SS25]